MAVDRLEDTVFWSHQFSEHAFFLHLGLTDPTLRDEALRLHHDWERFRKELPKLGCRGVQHAYDKADWLNQFIAHVQDAQKKSFVGWLYPLFLDHLKREGEYFMERVSERPPTSQRELCGWLQFMAEHSLFASHLLDPLEDDLVAKGFLHAGSFRSLQVGCGAAISDQLVQLSKTAGQALDAYWPGVAKAKSIIHPALAAHVVREGQRFLKVLDRLKVDQLAGKLAQAKAK